MHAARRFAAWYSGLLDRAPVRTKTVTAGLLAASGDFLAQLVVSSTGQSQQQGAVEAGTQPEQAVGSQTVDQGRSPSSHKQEQHRHHSPAIEQALIVSGADKAAADTTPSFTHDAVRSLRMASASATLTPFAHFWYVFLSHRFPGSPALCMALDQGLFAPVGGVAYLSIVGTLEARGSLQGGLDKVRSCYFDVMTGNYIVWPAVMFLNFKFVPVKYQVLLVNFVGLGWAVFASLVANRSSGSGGSSSSGESGGLTSETKTPVDATSARPGQPGLQ